MRNIIIGVIIGAALAALCLWLCRDRIHPVKAERIEIVHTDTLIVEKPVFLTRYVKDSILVPVTRTIAVHDTIYIYVERETREYRDSNYFAVVSGYQPSLDYIETYSATRTITVTETKRAPRWSFGIQMGAGVQYGIVNKRLDIGPYVGVGMQYRF